MVCSRSGGGLHGRIVAALEALRDRLTEVASGVKGLLMESRRLAYHALRGECGTRPWRTAAGGEIPGAVSLP